MPEYRVGDIVRTRRTGRVVAVASNRLLLEDVASGVHRYLTLDGGTLQVEMVRRSPEMHEGPKPPAGTIIRGRDMKRIWWKRGTIVRCVGDDRGLPVVRDVDNALVLRGDGKWYVLSNDHQSYLDSYEFEDLASDGRFQLAYVA